MLVREEDEINVPMALSVFKVLVRDTACLQSLIHHAFRFTMFIYFLTLNFGLECSAANKIVIMKFE